jgi:hypothetical protein
MTWYTHNANETILYLDEQCYELCMYIYFYLIFPIQNGLKHINVLSPILFIIFFRSKFFHLKGFICMHVSVFFKTIMDY